MVHFTVEEENLVCVYYKADRRRTMGRMTAALPDMDGDLSAVPRQAALLLLVRKEKAHILKVGVRHGFQLSDRLHFTLLPSKRKFGNFFNQVPGDSLLHILVNIFSDRTIRPFGFYGAGFFDVIRIVAHCFQGFRGPVGGVAE